MKVIFFGTPSFAATTLEHLLEHGIDIRAVVTRPDRPFGRSGKLRPSPVKQLILQKFSSVPLYQPDRVSTPPFQEELSQYGADLFIVVAYGEILKEHILLLPRFGCINLHASLLPLYRGASPIHFALLNGDERTGVTVIEMAKEMDAGPILSQKEVPIDPNDNFSTLTEKLCIAGIEQLLLVIRQYEEGTVTKKVQPIEGITFAPKVHPHLAQLDWRESAIVLCNRIRAFTPLPGAWCFVDCSGKKKRLKVTRAIPKEEKGRVGETLSYSSKGWQVGCGKGSITFLRLQMEGKKELDIEQFVCGISSPLPLLLPEENELENRVSEK